ncbi:MAG TPA: TetR/AcrR family transcriptional regulator [Actinophytocola sp.]|uniref:TetR/AcrR family transcriptional regulator n=1 Tax=Actinophytocola sp. TaxID=1872138 RepID=UPI002DDD2D4D|nr:TetR/AcrR family transcriptional regulator [Actinophytocola sp.]HEV2784334.1 TetR/AcrR family transcriptional regulator [Actinophytocola sp.]
MGRRIRGLDAEERRAQRRGQLLDAALELFAANGYQNTSIEQLCQAAFVGTKAFYEVFDSREDCYIALLREVTARLSARMVDALTEAPDDEQRATRMLVSTFAHALVDDPRIARVTFGRGIAVTPEVERQRRANRRWAAGFIETIWRRYGVLGDDRSDIDAHRMAIGVIGGMFDLIADWLLDADPGAGAGVDALITDLINFYDVIQTGLRRWRGPSLTV